MGIHCFEWRSNFKSIASDFDRPHDLNALKAKKKKQFQFFYLNRIPASYFREILVACSISDEP
jgi:hypothetical protein